MTYNLQSNRLNVLSIIKFFILTLFTFGSITDGNSQNVNLDWAVGFGGTSGDYALELTTDADGNVYAFGRFKGAVDFDPGPGVDNLTTYGNNDIYVSKFDSLGNYIWGITMGGSSNEQATEVKVDASGNVYISGAFQGTADFDPSAAVFNLTSAGSNDIYLAKYDSFGTFLWVKTMGSTGDDRGNSLVLDGSNIYLSGMFEATVDLNPGTGTNLFTSNGDQDTYFAKFDQNGNYLWAKTFGGTGDDGAYGIDLSPSGDIHLVGYFETTVDFDPGAGTANISSTGARDIFFSKYDNVGNFIWANYLAGTDGAWGSHLKVDALGNSFVGGSFSNTIDMDAGAGTANVTSSGANDVYVGKYDVNGNYTWAFSVGASSWDNCNNLSLDNSGNVYVTGYFNGTMDFDSGVGIDTLTAGSNSDAFVSKYNTNGDHVWALSMGGNDYQAGYGLEVDANNDVHVSGYFGGTSDFDPGSGTFNLTSNGGYDAFVVKLGATICTPNSGTDIQTACDSYTWIDGMTYTASNNTATYTLTNASGCDSIVTLDLTISASSASTDVITTCDSYTWIDGITYTASNNTATYILTNAVGCDSIITLDLTINYSNTGVDVISSCGPYIWIDGMTYASSNNTAIYTLTNASGCDSVVTLNLTIGSPNAGVDVISACDSYTWINGINYTSSNNTATHTLTNAAGCDSVVTLDLTINYSNTGVDVISACDAYTWINGINYTSSNNTATHTLTNAAGCDSVVTLDLTINYSNTGVDVISACDAYTWINGINYTSSNNTATHTLTNAAGCDSVVTLDLTINYSNTGVDIQTACDSYTWINGTTYTSSNNTATHTLTNSAGCDSVVTLDLIINYSNTGVDVQTACDSYTWIDGTTYSSSNNTATHTLTNAAGCDSVVTLNLTINSVSDVSTSTSGVTITAGNSSATYVWLDCDNNYSIIQNETGQSFTPALNGNYAVQLTENACADTSACVAITTIGIDENQLAASISVYPNPTKGNFTIDLGAKYEDAQITISDLKGRIVHEEIFGQGQILSLKLNAPQGMYLVKVKAGEVNTIIRLVID